MAFVSPDLPALPERLAADAHAIARRAGCGPSSAYPGQPNRPGRLPSQSDGHPLRAPFGARMSLFRLEVYLPCRLIRIRFAAAALSGAVAALWLTPAYAHAVCGARTFPATLAIDDPGVTGRAHTADCELGSQQFRRRAEWDASFSWTKTITPGLSVVIGSGPTWEHPGGYGWNALDTALQWQLLCIPDAEFMFKVGFDVSWGGTGTGMFAGPADQNTYTPFVDFGLGFGTLPQSLKYLRPFAVTGEFSTSTPGQDYTNGSPHVSTFNWGFTLQYSLPYFNTQLAEIDNDFLKRLIPVAEFAFQTPIYNGAVAGQTTTGYFQPGVIYEADKWQIALEAMVPMTGGNRSRRRRDRQPRFLPRQHPQQNRRTDLPPRTRHSAGNLT